MPGTPRPNIILFVTHDLGDRLGCYGCSSVRTPHLDRLAETGVRVANSYASAAECTPSRAGLLTGLLGHQSGLMGLGHFGWELAPGHPHLARRMWNAGYETLLFGFQHETARSPRVLGYNRMFSQLDQHAPRVCAELSDYLTQTPVNPDRPFFAHVGYTDVHRPWPPLPAEAEVDPDVPGYLPDLPIVREELAQLDRATARLDQAVGVALSALENSPHADNTLVLFVTDHGIPFPRAKSTLFDPGIRTAWLMRWPARVAGGRVLDGLVSNLDICPTILAAAGIPVPDGLEGRSVLPWLLGEPFEPREEVTGAQYFDVAYDPMHYVRTERYKYIRSFVATPQEAHGADPELLPHRGLGQWIRADDWDIQCSLTWQAMRDPAAFGSPPPEELYDLVEDPLEQRNLVAEPAAREALSEMRSRLSAMMARTQSPLRQGHVSPALSSTGNKPVR